MNEKWSSVIETLKDVPTETKIKAWVFEYDKKFYHVCSYTAFRMGDKVSIWESNKRGKRLTQKPLFTYDGSDHIKAMTFFLDSLEENFTLSDSEIISTIEKSIEEVREKKHQAVIKQEYEKAAFLRAEEKELIENLEKIKHK